MTDYEKHVFVDIYAMLYDVTQHVHKGCMVDQSALMQGAVALFDITLRREEEVPEWDR